MLSAFQFRVITSGIPATGGNVYNLAQGFGTTDSDGDGVADDPDEIVYDESGDDNPNNFSDTGTEPNDPNGAPDPSGGFDPDEDDGVADPDADGVDDDNDNSGEDENPDIGGGEDNVVPIEPGEPPADADILNGPDDEPDAINRTDDDDFQNLAIPFTDGDPTAVTFTNTILNNTTNAPNAPQLNNVVLLPLAPEVADSVNPEEEDFGENGDIPNDTRITITYDPDQNGTNPANDIRATYQFDGTNWVLVDNADPIPPLLPNQNLTTNADGDDFINIEDDLDPLGTTLDYTVVVDLPDNGDDTDDVLEGDDVPIPIIAFPNNSAPNDANPNI